MIGGGDGALLYELLKENPRNVIMLEIDDVVMKACAKYMRSICGDVLDKRSGPNYNVITVFRIDTVGTWRNVLMFQKHKISLSVTFHDLLFMRRV